MANFDWRRQPEDLYYRYDERVLGYSVWRELIASLLEALRSEQTALFLEAFDTFLDHIRKLDCGQVSCRLFVSHQRSDVLFAERIAYVANAEGFEYWLDIHDPTLKATTRGIFPPAVQSVLTAAIIEMALLNCTHGITVQTAKAQASRWVPYEFGRAKLRWLVSTQVASWFDNGIFQVTQADYLKLGICALSEKAVTSWLREESQRCRCRSIVTWAGSGEPPCLPN